MLFDALVINANPLLNLVHPGPYTPGAVNRVAALAMVAEGKGVNVARVLARHGHRVALTGFAGGHSGAWLRELVRAEGVHDAFVETLAPLRVGFMASDPQDEHPTTVFPGGFEVTQAECQALLNRVESWLDSVRLVIASGSVPAPVADGLYADLLALCERRGVRCWLDAYGPAMGRALAGPVAPGLSKPNRQEWAQSPGWERVEELHITDGAAAIEIVESGRARWRVWPPALRQVNPVGSGDCYLAGLAHGWLAGLSWEARLRYAVAAGAANALRPDVAMIAPEEIPPLLDGVRLERL
ncbi:tagatose 6-phosphate kinase [Methylomagnum ishizawai]|uniref:Phosphofructokinase n=1 Tax=Methylomagnum ishizawai TaxID=1760988 RepID=A0A1Y6D0U4_9GAMM|nr:PfkB family carbohydrate kinase [Methylomagnum ishizawai]SMF96548.1 tagatose 6-phosphate kinase [Methylomagnum ishizawai]